MIAVIFCAYKNSCMTFAIQLFFIHRLFFGLILFLALTAEQKSCCR